MNLITIPALIIFVIMGVLFIPNEFKLPPSEKCTISSGYILLHWGIFFCIFIYLLLVHDTKSLMLYVIDSYLTLIYIAQRTPHKEFVNHDKALLFKEKQEFVFGVIGIYSFIMFILAVAV